MKKKILYVLGAFCVLIFASFLVLKNGISISSVQFDFFKLEQLYIKLDKKLIVRAKNISLNQKNTNENLSPKDIDSFLKEKIKILENINYLYIFVQEIDVKNLDFNGDSIQVLFKDNDFFINNHSIYAKLSLQKEGKNINAEFKNVLLKDYNLSLVGTLNINTKSKFYHLGAQADSEFLDFNTSLSYKNGQLAYEFTDMKIHNFSQILNQVQKKISLPKFLVLWLEDRTKAEFYDIKYFKGFADLIKEDYYFDEIKALALAQNVEVRLDENMSAIEIPELSLKLEKQKLDFDFDKANYNGADLSGSSVALYDLFNENIGLSLYIKSSDLKLDEKLSEALKLYGLNLPIYQKSGKIQSDFSLKMNFNSKDSLTYNGSFELENAVLSLEDLNVNKALISLKNGNLSIQNASIKNNFLEATLNASVDLLNKKGVIDTQILRLEYPFLALKNQSIRTNLDFFKALKISVPQWGLNADLQKGVDANLSKISALVPYSPLLQKFGLKDALNVSYKSENFKDFILKIDEAKFKSDFLIDGKTPYESDSFDITSQNNVIQIDTQSKLLSASLAQTSKKIQLNQLTYIYKKSQEKSTFNLDNENIILEGQKVGIILADMNKTLEFDELKASLKNGILDAKAKQNNADFELHYAPNDLKLSAKNMDDEFINTFLQKESVKEGVFDLSISGSGIDFWSGKFSLKNTFVKDLKGVNTIISFMDTVPSLLLFKPPTFNQKGLKLQEGKVVFNRKKDLLSFSAINLDGDSVDAFGLGTANLRLGTLNLDLELKTLKSASEAISKVPILNYVILGKNQEISTNLKIDGSIDNPKVHTQILTDTLKTPFNLIKNVIQLPMNLLN